jgi:hypothetical protein
VTAVAGSDIRLERPEDLDAFASAAEGLAGKIRQQRDHLLPDPTKIDFGRNAYGTVDAVAALYDSYGTHSGYIHDNAETLAKKLETLALAARTLRKKYRDAGDTEMVGVDDVKNAFKVT